MSAESCEGGGYKLSVWLSVQDFLHDTKAFILFIDL